MPYSIHFPTRNGADNIAIFSVHAVAYLVSILLTTPQWTFDGVIMTNKEGSLTLDVTLCVSRGREASFDWYLSTFSK